MERVPARISPSCAPFHDPGFDIVARRERRKAAPVNDSRETWHCGAHKKRPLLPICAQKFSRRQAAEQS
jgi:hypothetical protein